MSVRLSEVNVKFPKIEDLDLNFKGIQAIHENLLKWILASACDSIKTLKIDGPVPFICDTFVESLFKDFPMKKLQEFSFQKARQVNIALILYGYTHLITYLRRGS
jgi:hypothetical protein